MSIILDVNGVINFKGPLTQTITKSVHVSNPNNDQTIAFKVKTTAPKLYSVRPNSGFIKPNETLEIIIMLQAFKKDFSPNQHNRDKFLIVSTLVDDIWMSQSISDLWTIVENHHKDRIHQQKIRCSYDLLTQTLSTEMNGTSNDNNSSNSDNNSNSQEKLEKEPNVREKFNGENTKDSQRIISDFPQQQQQEKKQENQFDSINNELNHYKQEIEMLRSQKDIPSANNGNTVIVTILIALVALSVYYYKYN